MKSRRDDLIIAQGKRGTSAALGNAAPPLFFSLSPRGNERGEGSFSGFQQPGVIIRPIAN